MPQNVEKRERTRSQMKTALVSLCQEKSYYDITVQEICDRAQVYRSTFYRYFETKDQLLREIEQEYVDNTRRLTPTLWSIPDNPSEEDLARYRKELVEDMEYHRDNRDLCRFLLSPAGDLYFYSQLVESVKEVTRQNMKMRGVQPSVDIENSLTFFAGGYVATINQWVTDQQCSPEEMADFMLASIRMFEQRW